ILVLRALKLTRNNQSGWQVRQTHGRIRSVNVLTTGSRRAIRIDAQIRLVYLNIDIVIDFRKNRDGRKTGMTTLCAIKRADANKPMNARLCLEMAVSEFTARNTDINAFDAGFVAVLKV